MKELFYTILYEPLFNFLIWMYDVLPGAAGLGVAIIVLTLVIKLTLFYPSLKALRSQKSLQDAQPKIEALKKEFADDKEELGRQIMQFYKDNKVNPFSSCLPLLIQLPVLWALFRVFFDGLVTDPSTGLLLAEQLEHLYQPLRDIYAVTPIDTNFFGVNLAESKNLASGSLAVAAGILQFLQQRMLMSKRAAVKSKGAKDENMAANLNKQMMYMMPAITIFFGYTFPAGVTLYWLCSTLFSWVQQLIFLRERTKMNEGDEEGAVTVVDAPSGNAKKQESGKKKKKADEGEAKLKDGKK